MKLRVVGSLFWMTVGTLFSFGQSDTVVYLDEVKVYGVTLDDFLPETSIYRWKSLDGQHFLSEIGQSSSVYFKNYGNGQLSTVALRGTSASHTQVLWNGLPTNAPTLSLTDFSIWPAFLLQDITLVRGSASSLLGSGAIGGSVVLDNRYIKKDSSLSLMVRGGSFGHLQQGLKIQSRLGKKLIAETRVFNRSLRNNFTYTYRGNEIRQPHASVKQLGLSQRLNLDLKKHFIYSEIAYARNDSDIQPTLSSVSRDQLLTDELRFVMGQESKRKYASHLSFGYHLYRTVFNDSSQTSSHQIIGNYSFRYHFKKWTGKAGINLIYGIADSDQYRASRGRINVDVFSLWNYQLSSRAKIILNIRESRSDQSRAFAPSIASEIGLFKGIHLDVGASRGFRSPSFNDLYWSPGGNPQLQPEISHNVEAGFSFKKNRLALKAKAFYSEISDWIQWSQLEGVWTPENLRRVNNRGIELELQDTWALGSYGSLMIQGAYEYTRSNDQAQENNTQLPYVPRHSAYLAAQHTQDFLSIEIRANYTGKRFSTLSNNQLGAIDSFLLTDLTLKKHFRLKAMQLQGSVSLLNVLDVDYQNVKNVAMPGRNFLIGLTTKF